MIGEVYERGTGFKGVAAYLERGHRDDPKPHRGGERARGFEEALVTVTPLDVRRATHAAYKHQR